MTWCLGYSPDSSTVTKIHFWHEMYRCTFPSRQLISLQYWYAVMDYYWLLGWCNWALLLMHSCLILLGVCFEGQIEFDSSSECVPVLSYLTAWIQQPCYPIYCNPRTAGVQAAFGCSMEALRTPGESTGTGAIARKCSRRDTYTIMTVCILGVCIYVQMIVQGLVAYRDMRLSTKCLMDIGICTRRTQYKWVIHANTSSTDMIWHWHGNFFQLRMLYT